LGWGHSPQMLAMLLYFNPLTGTLKPQSNGPLYSNTVIGTLAVDGWTVTFSSTKCNSPPISVQISYHSLWHCLFHYKVLKTRFDYERDQHSYRVGKYEEDQPHKLRGPAPKHFCPEPPLRICWQVNSYNLFSQCVLGVSFG